MDALFLIFGCVFVAVISLIFLAFNIPAPVNRIPYFATEVTPRVGQAILMAATLMLFYKAGQIPGILRHLLAARHKIAVAEARRQLEKNAPESGTMRQLFARHPDFGKNINLQDVAERDDH